MNTNCNKSVNPDVKVIMNYRRLLQITRCNNFIRNRTEDVGQHSFFTSVLAMAIGDDVQANNGIKLNMEMLLRKAILHDTEEAITSDVPFNVKHRTPEFNEQISKVLAEIAEESYTGASEIIKRYSKICSSSKDGFEGEIVDLADMIELGIYCIEEVQSGNAFMSSLLERAINISYERNQVVQSKFAGEMIEFLRSCTVDTIHTLNTI